MIVSCVGTSPSTARPCKNVLDGLLGAGIVQPAFFLQPGDGFGHGRLALRNPNRRSAAQTIADFFPQISHMRRKFLSPRRGLAAPEGNAGRRAMRVFHQHASRFAFHAADAPRSVAQQHDVARIALDGKVFVERADHDAFRFGDHGEERSLGNRAAAGDGRQPAAPPRPQLPVHPIVMDVGAVAPAPRGNAFGKHFEDRVVSFAREIAIGIGPRDQREEFVFIPSAIIFCVRVARAPRPRLESGRGHAVCIDRYRIVHPKFVLESSVPDKASGVRGRGARATRALLLSAAQAATICCARMSSGASGMIRRSRSPCRMARTSAAHSSRSSRVRGEESSFGNRAAPVAGTSHSLQRDRNRPRRTDLHHQVHGADINSQFERRGRHQHFDFAFFQFLFRGQAQLARQGCHDGLPHCLRPAVRPGGARFAPPAAGC